MGLFVISKFLETVLLIFKFAYQFVSANHLYLSLLPFVFSNSVFFLSVCADVVETLFHQAGFQTLHCDYAYRRTVNKKEGIDVPRIFVQAKFVKPGNAE